MNTKESINFVIRSQESQVSLISLCIRAIYLSVQFTTRAHNSCSDVLYLLMNYQRNEIPTLMMALELRLTVLRASCHMLATRRVRGYTIRCKMMSLPLLMQYLRLTVVTSRCVMERIDRLHLKGMIIIGLRHNCVTCMWHLKVS